LAQQNNDKINYKVVKIIGQIEKMIALFILLKVENMPNQIESA